jgi:hypothetical protein
MTAFQGTTVQEGWILSKAGRGFPKYFESLQEIQLYKPSERFICFITSHREICTSKRKIYALLFTNKIYITAAEGKYTS